MNRPLGVALRYNKWANEQLLAPCRSSTEEQLDSAAPATGRSIRQLLTHLVAVARDSSDELIRIAEELDEDVDVDLPWQGKAFRFPRGFFLAHALEHGSEHRTEVRVALELLGIKAPELDGWEYDKAAGYGVEARSPDRAENSPD